MLLQQADVLAFDEQQGNTDDRHGRQHSQCQTQAKYGLMSKTQHYISLLLTPPWDSVADLAVRSEAGWAEKHRIAFKPGGRTSPEYPLNSRQAVTLLPGHTGAARAIKRK